MDATVAIAIVGMLGTAVTATAAYFGARMTARYTAQTAVAVKAIETAPAIEVARIEAQSADATGRHGVATEREKQHGETERAIIERLMARVEQLEDRGDERDKECDRKLDAMAARIDVVEGERDAFRRDRDDLREELHNTIAELQRQREDEKKADRRMWEARLEEASRRESKP